MSIDCRYFVRHWRPEHSEGSLTYWIFFRYLMHSCRGFCSFLADRTNGRAYATVFRLSVCLSVVCLSVTLCIVAKQCVLEQKLLLRAYRKSYMRNRLVLKWMTLTFDDLDLCLEVISRSRQPLCYIRRWISRKPLEIEARFQRTTNRKWHTGYRMVTWPMTSRDLERSNLCPQYA